MATAVVVDQQLEQTALTTVQQARAMEVKTVEQRTLAAETGRIIAGLIKEATDWFAPMKRAAAAAHKEICNRENSTLEPLEAAKRYLSTQIGQFDAAEEQRRRVEEARLQEVVRQEAEAEARRVAEDRAILDAIEAEGAGDAKAAAALLNNPVPVEVYVAPVILPTSVPKTAGVSARKAFKFRITDVNAINRDYLVADEKKIGQVVRALGLKAAAQIGGIEVYEENSAAFRA